MAHVLEILGWEPMREHMTVGVLGTLGLFHQEKDRRNLAGFLDEASPT